MEWLKMSSSTYVLGLRHSEDILRLISLRNLSLIKVGHI